MWYKLKQNFAKKINILAFLASERIAKMQNFRVTIFLFAATPTSGCRTYLWSLWTETHVNVDNLVCRLLYIIIYFSDVYHTKKYFHIKTYSYVSLFVRLILNNKRTDWKNFDKSECISKLSMNFVIRFQTFVLFKNIFGANNFLIILNNKKMVFGQFINKTSHK